MPHASASVACAACPLPSGLVGALATHVSQQHVRSRSGSLAFQSLLLSSWGWQESDRRFERSMNLSFSDKRASPKGAFWSFSLTSPHMPPFSVCFCSFLLMYSSVLHRLHSSNQSKLFNFSLRTSWATAPTIPTTTILAPRVMNVEKNAAYPKAIAELKTAGVLPQHVELRQVKYLNNLIEQDHRFIKRLTKPGMGFFSFETARRTRQGFEMMNRLRKGQRQTGNKGDVRGQVALVAKLFGVAA